MDKFSALADSTRRTIMEILAREGALPATDIYEHFSMSAPAVSQHLKALREAHLVRVEKRAQQRIYRIDPEAMLEVEEWSRKLRDLWDRRFDALEKLIEEEKREEKEQYLEQE
jgi:DNA-binding transcriptional ArsR family regulator